MSERRCPNCGELVPSNSITCPKCFKKMPQEPEPAARQRPEGQAKTGRTPNRKVAIALDVILGLFGILGIGQLYMGQRRGVIFLALGLMFFIPAIILTVFLVTVILAVPFFIIYALLYIVTLADVFLGSIALHIGFGR